MAAATTTPQQEPPYSLSLHSVIESMQTNHGLYRHGNEDDKNYKEYHAYCTRRLHRLRHNKAVKKDLVHNAMHVPGVGSKKRHAYCPRQSISPEDVKHENVVWVLLVGAERAWAFALQVKYNNNSNNTPGASISKARRYYLRRLRRAKSLALELQDMIQQVGDDTTKMEANAYASWMTANLDVEMGNWKNACKELQNAINLCRQLADQDDDLERRDIFTFRVNNVLKPLWNYCRYEWRESGDGDDDGTGLDGEDADGPRTVNTKGDTTVEYRGTEIIIENKNLKVLMLKMDTFIKDLDDVDQLEGEAFMSLLSAYDDALKLVQTEHKTYQDMKAGPAVNAKRQELEYLQGYWKFKKQEWLIKRHEHMLGQCTKTADKCHMYDALLRDAKLICELPGGASDDEFALAAMANVLRIRAFRAYHVALLYLSLGKSREAYALLQQSKQLSSRATEEIAASDDMAHADEYLDALEGLELDIMGALVRVKAQAYLGDTASSAETAAGSGDLLSNLNVFLPNHNFTNLMPLAVPSKPAFFDVAWHHASRFPMEDLQRCIDETKPKSSGLLGWFR